MSKAQSVPRTMPPRALDPGTISNGFLISRHVSWHGTRHSRWKERASVMAPITSNAYKIFTKLGTMLAQATIVLTPNLERPMGNKVGFVIIFEIQVSPVRMFHQYPQETQLLHLQYPTTSSLMVCTKSLTSNTLTLLLTSSMLTRSDRSLVLRLTQALLSRRYVLTVGFCGKGWTVAYWFGSGR